MSHEPPAAGRSRPPAAARGRAVGDDGGAMRFSSTPPPYELTYDDVFLVPGYSEVASRMDVDLTPDDGTGATIPLVVANMTAVTGRRMAETVARRGGLAVLPQDAPPAKVTETARYLKSRHTVYETPVVLRAAETIQSALGLVHKRAHGAVVVVDDDQRPVGVFTEKDAQGQDRFAPLREVMSADVVTLVEPTPGEAYEALRARRVSVLPVVDAGGRLVGVVTALGALRSTIYRPAVDGQGRLLVAAAVGVGGDVAARCERLLEAGADLLVLDTAHGHQRAMLAAVRAARAVLGAGAPLVAGNVATARATCDLVEAGASIVKVGVGPGAMCTTRMQTGAGRPQFSAVHECAAAARAAGAHVWADGGVSHPRDLALALAAGASAVVAGTLFAGTHEAAADVQHDEHGRPYKENYGMASTRAVAERNRAEEAFLRARRAYFSEGVSSSRCYLRPGEAGAEDVVDRLMAGLRSACTYAGAADLGAFFAKAVVGVQSAAGFREGEPRD